MGTGVEGTRRVLMATTSCAGEGGGERERGAARGRGGEIGSGSGRGRGSGTGSRATTTGQAARRAFLAHRPPLPPISTLSTSNTSTSTVRAVTSSEIFLVHALFTPLLAPAATTPLSCPSCNLSSPERDPRGKESIFGSGLAGGRRLSGRRRGRGVVGGWARVGMWAMGGVRRRGW